MTAGDGEPSKRSGRRPSTAAEAVAQARATSDTEELRRLVIQYGHHDKLLEAIADNVATPPEILVVLVASQKAHWAQLRAGRNPSFPRKPLVALARSDDNEMRKEVAGNPMLPKRDLEKLRRDSYPRVRVQANANPSLPRSVLNEVQISDLPWWRLSELFDDLEHSHGRTHREVAEARAKQARDDRNSPLTVGTILTLAEGN